MIEPDLGDPCHLRCPWSGRAMCVRCLLSPAAIAEHHVSLGVTCGLRHIYFPNSLPPCVHHNGEIDWHYAEEELEEAHAAMLV